MRESGILPQTASEQTRPGWSNRKWLAVSILLFIYLLFSLLLFDPRLHTGDG